MSEKMCLRCEVVKPLDDFIRDSRVSSGIGSQCKKCKSEIDRDFYERNKARKLKTVSARYKRVKNTEQYKNYQRAKQNRHRAKYPDKTKARTLANLYKNKIRKSSCENCGAVEHLNMHHIDYSKPLDVITLCRDCHLLTHQKERALI